ncbi:hypothetical protein HZH68_012746 [Vespula germanica]|uniref:Uncharacterized protein n=1 Tax=Vespula germanica TaxID=30212 RepID=A0A834JET6_VESGE|nr:hypothetical protein HZH68_012746 [Vespula germanica]
MFQIKLQIPCSEEMAGKKRRRMIRDGMETVARGRGFIRAICQSVTALVCRHRSEYEQHFSPFRVLARKKVRKEDQKEERGRLKLEPGHDEAPKAIRFKIHVSTTTPSSSSSSSSSFSSSSLSSLLEITNTKHVRSLRQSVQRGLYQLQAKEQEQEQEEQEKKKKRRREEEKENEKEKE